MNKNLILFTVSICLLLLFYGFSREVKRGFLKQADFNFTVILQDHMPARLDSVWETIALPVTPAPSVFVVGMLSIAAFVDFKKKKIRLRALVIPLLFGLLIVGELYGKSVVHHPSPPFFMIKHPTTVFPQFYVNEQYSYPSGHTARATFLGFTLFSILAGPWVVWRKNWRRVVVIGGTILAYVIAVGLGRIYLGSHWLSDVMGGGALGSGLGLLILTIG